MFGINEGPRIRQRFMDNVLHWLSLSQCFFEDTTTQGKKYYETILRLRESIKRVKQTNKTRQINENILIIDKNSERKT